MLTRRLIRPYFIDISVSHIPPIFSPKDRNEEHEPDKRLCKRVWKRVHGLSSNEALDVIGCVMPDFDPVHTRAEGFDGAALFLPLGSSSSLNRNENGALICENATQPGSYPEEFEYAEFAF